MCNTVFLVTWPKTMLTSSYKQSSPTINLYHVYVFTLENLCLRAIAQTRTCIFPQLLAYLHACWDCFLLSQAISHVLSQATRTRIPTFIPPQLDAIRKILDPASNVNIYRVLLATSLSNNNRKRDSLHCRQHTRPHRHTHTDRPTDG